MVAGNVEAEERCAVVAKTAECFAECAKPRSDR
jgi:hypothetical protein